MTGSIDLCTAFLGTRARNTPCSSTGNARGRQGTFFWSARGHAAPCRHPKTGNCSPDRNRCTQTTDILAESRPHPRQRAFRLDGSAGGTSHNRKANRGRLLSWVSTASHREISKLFLRTLVFFIFVYCHLILLVEFVRLPECRFKLGRGRVRAHQMNLQLVSHWVIGWNAQE